MAGYGRTARLYFYPRSPCGERLATSAAVASPKNFYPRSPCGERLASSYGHFRDLQISIHALLAESDHPCGRLYPVQLHISIHALLAESDLRIPSTKSTLPVFLSTLSLRRATSCRRCEYLHWWISIHALLAESDIRREISLMRPYAFLSTLSLRRATKLVQLSPLQYGYFYPRSPCGERRGVISPKEAQHDFYPRSPCGERLQAIVPLIQDAVISIHALLAESDGHPSSVKSLIIISIHALLAESDRNGHPDTRQRDAISIHALLAESDLNLATS